MATVVAPFLIKGTLDEINFVVTADGNNYARAKGKTGVTSTEFKNNPIFDRIRNQGQEFGHCSKKSVLFRQLAVRFNKLAKDGSVAGRANKLLFEILQEDATQPQGQRTLAEGLKTSDGKECLLFFESNKLRPLDKVLKIKESCNRYNQTVTLTDFLAKEHLDWPEEATHVHFASATANWDYENDNFDTCYSDEIIVGKESAKQTLTLSSGRPIASHLHLTFLFIGFAIQERKKHKFLHHKNNTATLISYHNPSQPINPKN
jgi:hypothetical protein